MSPPREGSSGAGTGSRSECGGPLPDANAEMFRLLVASVRDYAIFMLDPTGRVATWNPGAQRIKGYSAAEIVGRHFSTFYVESEVASGKCELELETAVRVGRFEDEGWRVRKDGEQFWANVVITAVFDEAGVLVGFAKVTRDLTERKRAEEQLAARRAAEEANRAKDEFLAMLGHELRNPLAPIATALQLVKLRSSDGRLSNELQVIDRQVQHLLHLVDDLLDVSRISRGKLELRKQRIDLRTVIGKAIEIASTVLEQRGHHLSVDVPRRQLAVDGDEARLTQVAVNLLTNAAKYTEPGGDIAIGVRVDGRELVIEVRDNGIGIEPELLPQVFDLFVQGKRQVDRAAGGLGLGLTLVKKLIELHGGVVTAASGGVGKGSTFEVRLPASARLEADEPRAPRASALVAATNPQRILIVDDNEDARVLLADVLGMLGHRVEAAGDPATALQLAAELVPEVAILDIGLPVMDGYELAQRLRELPGPAPRMIALTGYGQQRDRERSAAAGFEVHLVKPVDMKRLLRCINADS